jgi:secreted trypsin-like serine protease
MKYKKYLFFSYIITASHCIVDESEDEIRVRVGQHSLLESTPLLNVSKIIKHSKYDTTSQFNDIALLKLKNPVQFTKNIQPVCLPPSDLDDPKGLFAAGWGRIDEGGRTSDRLHHVSLPKYSSAKCDAKFGGLFTDNHLCAGGVKGQDACQGDSGGPLTSRSRNRVELIGIVSWGIGLHLKQIINYVVLNCISH